MLQKLPDQFNALVVGASRGIGLGITRALLADARVGRVYGGCREPEQAHEIHATASTDCRLRTLRMDVMDEHTVEEAAGDIRRFCGYLHLVIVTAGVLHDPLGMEPERRLAAFDPEIAARSMQVNAFGPLLVLKHFAPLMASGGTAYFASLSARVGSIGDNRIGGWYSYRAAKAAQNQLVHTAAIELARQHPELVCVTLHPGTVDTDLSKPFQGRVPADRLFDVERASGQLLDVLGGLTAGDSGGFFAWDGAPVPW
ncbi:SDR family oxidoreductase [Algiphilus sp.]|uniref:SDR family oxidoreductase n=1 Tax=Algiphilus sp. TaxID=1872431 RepID=UPI003C4854B3